MSFLSSLFSHFNHDPSLPKGRPVFVAWRAHWLDISDPTPSYNFGLVTVTEAFWASEMGSVLFLAGPLGLSDVATITAHTPYNSPYQH